MKVALLLIFAIGFAACQPKAKQREAGTLPKGEPKFGIQKEIHNFGTVHAGELLSYSFKFTNDGKSDLKIDSVLAGCGCLEVSFPHEPVKAGEDNYIEVLFNSAGEVGNVLKQIRVYTNASEKAHELIITAKVENELINIYN
jgi:hypothetical protein